MRGWCIAIVMYSSSAFAAPLRPEEVPEDVYLDRSGMPELVVQSAFNGAVIGSFVTQLIFADSDPNRAASGTLVGAGLGIGLPMLLLRGQPVHAAEAASYNFGMRWGLVTGLVLPALWGSRTPWHYGAAVGVLTLAGLGTSILAYPRYQPSPGQVSALGTAHTFGTIAAGLMMVVYNVVPDNDVAYAAPVLAVANAGLIAAWVLRDDFDIDRRRVIMADIGGYVGIGTGLGFAYLLVGNTQFEEHLQVVAGCMLAGMGAGLVMGYVLSDGLDEYRRAAPPPSLVTLESPQPALLSTLNAKGEPTVAVGVDILRGTW